MAASFEYRGRQEVYGWDRGYVPIQEHPKADYRWIVQKGQPVPELPAAIVAGVFCVYEKWGKQAVRTFYEAQGLVPPSLRVDALIARQYVSGSGVAVAPHVDGDDEDDLKCSLVIGVESAPGDRECVKLVSGKHKGKKVGPLSGEVLVLNRDVMHEVTPCTGPRRMTRVVFLA